MNKVVGSELNGLPKGDRGEAVWDFFVTMLA